MAAHLVYTGPHQGDITLDDGTTYTVSPDEPAQCSTAEHAAELAHRVSLHYAQHGHPEHPDGLPYNEKGL